MKKLLLLFCSVLFSLSMLADGVITGPFTLSNSIDQFEIDKNEYEAGELNWVDDYKWTFELRQISFGKNGNTVILKLNIPQAAQEGITSEYSWSGKNVHIYHEKNETGDMYYIVNSPLPIDIDNLSAEYSGATVMHYYRKDEKKWRWAVVLQNGSNAGTVSNIFPGQTPEQLASIAHPGKLNYVGKRNGYDVYSFYTLGITRNRYNNTAGLQKYGDFFFKDGKLSHWLLYFTPKR